MILAISGRDEHLYPQLFDDVYQLRHQVFVDEMHWDNLRSPDGRERDQFDDEHAVHHIALRDDNVVGYQRILKSTRPHLLDSVFPHLCEGEMPAGPHICEVSRYCVAPGFREGRRSVSTVGSELVAAVVEWGLSAGYSKALFQFEPMWLLRGLQLKFLVRPLGYQVKIGELQVVAAELGFNATTLETIRSSRAYHLPVVEAVGELADRFQEARAS
jgi:acyl-homoserine lactone synthase